MVSTNKNSIFYKNNSGLSTALVLILLLFMSVFIFTMVSNYFNLTLDNFKLDQQLDNFETKFEIVSIDGNLLTIDNSFKDNLQIKSIKINSIDCEFYPSSIDVGTKIINLGDCAKDLSLEQIYSIIIETQYGVVIENEIFESLDLSQVLIEYLSQTPMDSESILVDYFRVQTSNSLYSQSSTWINFDNSLIGYWNFDSSNSTHVFDLSGNNNHGEFIGGVKSNNTNRVRGNYLELDGINDYVELGNIMDDVVFPVTISAWVYDNTTDIFPIFQSDDSSVYAGFMLRISSDNTIRSEFGNGVSASSPSRETKISSVTAPQNTWINIIIIFNGADDMGIYLNSVLVSGNYVGTGDIMVHNGDSARIGRRIVYNQFSKGKIDEVMIFNRTLSANEIKSLYNSNINAYDNTFSNLTVGNYTFQTCEIDGSGNYGCLENRTVTVS